MIGRLWDAGYEKGLVLVVVQLGCILSSEHLDLPGKGHRQTLSVGKRMVANVRAYLNNSLELAQEARRLCSLPVIAQVNHHKEITTKREPEDHIVSFFEHIYATA